MKREGRLVEVLIDDAVSVSSLVVTAAVGVAKRVTPAYGRNYIHDDDSPSINYQVTNSLSLGTHRHKK